MFINNIKDKVAKKDKKEKISKKEKRIDLTYQVDRKNLEKNKKRGFILMITGILVGILFIINIPMVEKFKEIAMGGDGSVSEIKRKGAGEGEETYNLRVDGLDKDITVEVKVPEVMLEGENATKWLKKEADKLPEMILGENPSVNCIYKSLDLPEKLGNSIKIKWESDNIELVSNYGYVFKEKLTDEGSTVILRANLSYRSYEYTKSIVLTVKNKPLTEDEQIALKIQEAIEQNAKIDPENNTVMLPNTIENTKISFNKKSNRDFLFLALVIIVLGAYYFTKDSNDEKEYKKSKTSELKAQYASFLSKLSIYMQAGLTLRSAWQTIVRNYRRDLAKGGSKKAVYEEMIVTSSQLDNGVSEEAAYQDFGIRCGLTEYKTAMDILITTLKKGADDASTLLKMEVRDAFSQKKNNAKKAGEKAGTKLLAPMMIMLGVVLFILVVPTFMNMSL